VPAEPRLLIDRIDQTAKTELLKLSGIPSVKCINRVTNQSNGQNRIKCSSRLETVGLRVLFKS
jgi:hypothetical protein